MRSTCARMVLACTAVVVLASTGWAQQDKDKDHDGHRHRPQAPAEAAVDFGVLSLTPIGPPPCFQTGAIGGPDDPCSYLLHRLIPDEVTVREGGEVTFQIHGGGHGFAIYEVSRNTTREDLGQYLCAGPDPATVTAPASHPCNLLAANANAKHIVLDGRHKVVLVAEQNLTNAHPDNRVWSEDDRLMSAGGRQFLNGGTIPAGATSNGQLLTYRFLESGRYLVICMNRTHFLNDWMFGFVDVVDRGRDE